MTLIEHLLASADEFGDSEISFFDGQVTTATTVSAVHTRAVKVAAALQERGIGPGDVVAVQLPNRFETAVAYQAVLLTGATLLPIVHIYGPREVEFVLHESGARMLVMQDAWRGIDYAGRIPGLVRPGLEIVLLGAPTAGTTPWSSLKGDRPRALLEAAPHYVPPKLDSTDIAILSYTSGTTSSPKGAQHSGAGMLAEVTSQVGMIGYGTKAVQLASFPFGHIAGLLSLLRPLLLGTPTVVMDG